jgi:ABC-type polar amino acid transport system ATPase subunit
MLKGEQLTKRYGNQTIVDNLDIELNPGEINVVIGPSGSGKTTLIKLLALLERADQGTVTVDDVVYPATADLKKVEPPWPKLTVVFQQLFLWPHLTLMQNILLPRAARGLAEDPPQLDELLELFDMKKFVQRYPNEASVGQRQRAALLRALLLEPKYLLLDEITSSLDVEQVAIILSHLKELAKQGIGILTITHLLHFAREAADKIYFVEGGRIIASGGKEVIDAPRHERVKKFLSVIESAS